MAAYYIEGKKARANIEKLKACLLNVFENCY